MAVYAKHFQLICDHIYVYTDNNKCTKPARTANRSEFAWTVPESALCVPCPGLVRNCPGSWCLYRLHKMLLLFSHTKLEQAAVIYKSYRCHRILR